MPVKMKLDLSGKDSTFGSNCIHYCNGLEGLELYKSAPEKFKLARLKERLNSFLITVEGAANGDRVQIAKRNKARKELTEMFIMVLHYLRAVADEDDIPALMQVGFEVFKTSAKRKAVVALATT